MTKWSLKYLKIILFGMWLVYTKIWYTYTYYINGNDLVSQKWQKMTIDVWLDIKEKQQNGIKVAFEIWLVYVLVYSFFWYADGIHIYWNLQNERYMFWYKTRNDCFWLVYIWYMVSWYTYNGFFLLWQPPVWQCSCQWCSIKTWIKNKRATMTKGLPPPNTSSSSWTDMSLVQDTGDQPPWHTQ